MLKKAQKINDSVFEIDLKQFLINTEIFNDKILEIVSTNCGWMAGDTAVFTLKEERDYCKSELKDEFENNGDIDEIYHAVLDSFPNLPLSDRQDEIKQAIHDLLDITISTITDIQQKSETVELKNIKFYWEHVDELSKIDETFDIILDDK
ncbi:MAG: hypothetical protein ACFFBP_06780 [Promethearchaeota archaeon]